METNQVLQVVKGTVAGKTHTNRLGNNQDAVHITFGHSLVALAICDGCSSSESSEFGAQLGVRLTTEAITREYLRGSHSPSDPKFWERIRQELLAQIRVLALSMGGSFSETIDRYFLFTILAGFISPEMTVFTSIGDGVFIVNGEIIEISPMEGNIPPYIAYELIETDFQFQPQDLQFSLIAQLPTSELQHFLLGSDGCLDLIASADKTLPGRGTLIGPISQFWTQDQYFNNPDAVRRILAKVNKSKLTIDWGEQTFTNHPGLLPDDTTLIAGRFDFNKE